MATTNTPQSIVKTQTVVGFSLFTDYKANRSDMFDKSPEKTTQDKSLEKAFSIKSYLELNLAAQQQQLSMMDSTVFALLTQEAHKKAIEEQLLFTEFLIKARLRMVKAENRQADIIALEHDLIQIEKLLTLLKDPVITPVQQNNVPTQKSERSCSIGNPIKALISRVDNESTIEFLHRGNMYRLYLLWGNSSLYSIFEALSRVLSHNPNNINQAVSLTNTTSIISGYVGWIFLFIRLGINGIGFTLTLLTANEKDWVVCVEIFKNQWKLRKYFILNDIVWGFINLVTFYLFLGTGPMIYLANILTLGALLMDLVVTCRAFNEDRDAHYQKIDNLTQIKDTLTERLNNLKQTLKSDTQTLGEILFLEKQIREQQQLIDKENLDFKYLKYNFFNDVFLSSATFFSYGLLAAFLCPVFLIPGGIVGSTMLALTLAGSIICFVLMGLHSIITDSLQIHKAKQLQSLNQNHSILLENEYKNASPEEQPFILLDLLQIRLEREILRQTLLHKQTSLIVNTLTFALVPTILFVSLVFVPMPLNFLLIGSGVLITLCFNLLVKHFFKPEDQRDVLVQEQEKFKPDSPSLFWKKWDNKCKDSNPIGTALPAPGSINNIV